MKSIITKDFNLTYTIESGEFFRWNKINNFYIVISENYVIKIKQVGNILYYEGCPENYLKKFFRLDFPLEDIEGFKKFTLFQKIFKEFRGLRLIKQNLWECILSYILSINSSIKIIKNNLEWLSQRYGQYKKHGFYLLPKPHQLSGCYIPTKRFGLRAKFLRRLPQSFLTLQHQLKKNLSYYQKKELLLNIYGVGDKVSECILLYSLNEDNAFPVDRWIARFLIKYFDLKIKNPSKIREWAQDRFGEKCGWVQQYIYMFARNYKIK